VAEGEVLKVVSLLNPLHASANYTFLLILDDKAFGSYFSPHLLTQCSKVIPGLTL
jgi:hypothetical protein